jgi:hypothetical protein
LTGVNPKRITGKGVKIWAVWLLSILGGFVFAGGLRLVNPLYMSETGISVDEPLKYITYYGVILLFAVISVLAGRRASCH